MLNTVRSNFSVSSSWGRAFVVTFVFVTLASGLFWLDFFRSYRAEVTVLIVSKAGMPQVSQEVTGNMAELIGTLSFYERVLAGNDLIDDAFEGYAPDKRKALWNDTVSVKQQDGSSVLSIQAKGETSEMAKRLARETAQTLFAVAGFYYNVKTDIDMRIIDGPFAAYVLVSPILFGMTSILTGFLLTLLFFWLLKAAPGFIGGRKESALPPDVSLPAEKAYPEFALGETVPWLDPKKFIPAKPSGLSFENAFQETKDMPLSHMTHPVAHAPAPANLPIADTEEESPLMESDEAAFPFEFETPAEESEEIYSAHQGESLGFPVRGEHAILEKPPIAPRTGEPTSDEYKRRLNELLSGGK